MASEELADLREMLAGVDVDAMPIEQRRSLMTRLAAPPPEGTLIEPVDADGVAAEWITRASVAPERVILYFHGGGYNTGTTVALRPMLALLSTAAGASVLSVDYRLAPEHPFPAAVRDALTAYQWLTAQAHGRPVVIAGNSAGGGLALATLVALRDAGERLPDAAVLISPWTDLAMTGESVRTRAAVDFMLSPRGLAEAADLYLAGQDPTHPHASPLHADPRGLPPTLLHVGDADMLRDDSTRFAAQARSAGVNVTIEVWDEMPHCWHTFADLLPEADDAISRIGLWLDDLLDSPAVA